MINKLPEMITQQGLSELLYTIRDIASIKEQGQTERFRLQLESEVIIEQINQETSVASIRLQAAHIEKMAMIQQKCRLQGQALYYI